MAKQVVRTRQAIAFLVVMAMLGLSPLSTYANHKKYFKEGMSFEENKQWDKAAEKFALAVAEKPSNIEYQIHFQRALVNAGIMLVERGDRLAVQKDFNAAYQAYRQAYSFDPTNDVARIKMRRMLEEQGLPTDGVPGESDPAGPKWKRRTDSNMRMTLSPTGHLVPTGNNGQPVQLPGMPSTRKQQVKTDVIARSDNLLSFIEQLAQAMGLNVVFDYQVAQSQKNQKLVIELRNVTRSKALEIILRAHNLMYIPIDTRTLMIALDNPQSRAKYEQLVARTFYIKNADVQEIRTVINTTLQTKFITPVKYLNALIVRDTPANLEMVEALIDSLDKSKAEVLIDVNIYEVSRNNLLSLGNQFAVPDSGSGGGLTAGFLGGLGQSGAVAGAPRSHTFIKNTSILGFALGLPTSAISFFQDKGKAKLLASTQVHVLDNEDQSINIGQRVPIQTAAFPTYTNPTRRDQRAIEQATGLNQNDLNPGLGGFFGGFSGGAFPQIQYENVGLNIDMKPQVFEDEVHMKMKISSTSLDTSTGKLTPSFNQRTMNSVARIKDGQPTLIAGVSQTNQSKTVKGVPLLGLIPILGRFFATPDTIDRQSDVVITVTPHILRRADITDRDHLAREAGRATDPSVQLTIENILYLAELEDLEQQRQIASLNGGAAPTLKVPSVETRAPAASPPPQAIPTPRDESPPGVVVIPTANPVQPKTSSSQIVRERVGRPGEPLKPASEIDDDDDDDDDDDAQLRANSTPVTITVKSASAVAVKGQDLYVAVIVNGNGDVASSNLSLSYDSSVVEVKGVRDGGLLSSGGFKPELQFSAEGGLLNVQLGRPMGSPGVLPRGQLLLIVFTVRGQGQTSLTLNDGQTYLRASSGQSLPVRLLSTQIDVK
jgi:general secretion pathway protein D